MLFYNKNSNTTSEHTDAIVPIVYNKNGCLQIIGTAFYISSFGLLVTAKHVVYTQILTFLGWINVPIKNISIIHFLSDGKYVIRPILKVVHPDNYDIAYLIPDDSRNAENESIVCPALALTDYLPQISDRIATYAYPNSFVDENNDVPKINVNADFFEGNITNFYLNDPPTMLAKNSSCYESNMPIAHGASGGPVFGPNGAVFGVCSIGTRDNSISYVVPIVPSFSVRLPILPNGEEITVA